MPEQEKINSLIENSGIITHKKVIDLFRKNGWNLVISPYYYDNILNNVREIDLIAEKSFGSCTDLSQSKCIIDVQLFIECKYINQEIAFWFDKMDEDRAVKKLEAETGLKIHHKRYSADIPKNDFRHLKQEKVAKLFTSNLNNQDIIFKAITQCLNAQIYYKEWHVKSRISKETRSAKSMINTFRIPIIICDNFEKLQEVSFPNSKLMDELKYSIKEIDKSFLLEIYYTYLNKDNNAKTDYFLIDIVNIENVEDFFNELEKEIKAIIEVKIF